MGFKLDDIWEQPAYPKKGVYSNLDDSIWQWRDVSETALKEIKNCMGEKEPSKVVIANLSVLFWVFKGMNFNYGGLKSLPRREVRLMHMCEKYVPINMISYADSVRGVLERYPEQLFPMLKEKAPSDFNTIKVIHSKLILVIYDLILSAIAFERKGDIWSKKDGYSVSGDGFGNYSVKEREVTYDSLHFVIHHPSDVLGIDKFQAYIKGRPIVAERVSQIDSTYPYENNTWLYFKTDINELRDNIYPIYETAIEDQTPDYKQLNVRTTKKIEKIWLEYLEVSQAMSLKGLLFPNRIKKYDNKDYKVGKLKQEEMHWRKTIYLNKKN